MKTVGQDSELLQQRIFTNLKDVVGINYWDFLTTSLQTACILNIFFCDVFCLTVNSAVLLPHSRRSKNTLSSQSWKLGEM